MPALVIYQIVDGDGSCETTIERGLIERWARECALSGSTTGLDRTVIETRYNVIRSSVPQSVTTVRTLRHFLPATADTPS
jgi:hypothetical protein